MRTHAMRCLIVTWCLGATGGVLAGCTPDMATGMSSDLQMLAKGGKPGGGGEGLIAAVKLPTLPRGTKCGSVQANGINGNLSAFVVGFAVCSGVYRPAVWSVGSSASIFGDGAYAGALSGVADDGTMAGSFREGQVFSPVVIPAGANAPIVLPLPAGLLNGDTRDITADARHILGTGWAAASGPTHVLVWTRNNAAPSGWVVEEVAQGTCEVDEISDDGGVIVGALGGHAVAWIRSGGWQRITLPDDDGTLADGALVEVSRARGINARGDVIAGDRWVTMATGAGQNEPLAWRLGSGGWVLERLPGWGRQIGAASGVADVAGETVIVGALWDGVNVAAAWRTTGGGGGPFGTPLRLEPLSARSSAYASEVNRHGLAIGYAYTGGSGYPVTWQLP